MKKSQGMGQGTWWEDELKMLEGVLKEGVVEQKDQSPTSPNPTPAVWVLYWPPERPLPIEFA